MSSNQIDANHQILYQVKWCANKTSLMTQDDLWHYKVLLYNYAIHISKIYRSLQCTQGKGMIVFW